MAFSEYKVIVTNEAYRELEGINEYITYNLYAEKAAQKLMQLIEKEFERLEYSPLLYPEIEKIDQLKRRYRRIIVKNYIILYILEQKDNAVYVFHIYNGRRNYINNNYL